MRREIAKLYLAVEVVIRRHMWTAPIGKHFFDVSSDLVCLGHMSGLLVRFFDRWP